MRIHTLRNLPNAYSSAIGSGYFLCFSTSSKTCSAYTYQLLWYEKGNYVPRLIFTRNSRLKPRVDYHSPSCRFYSHLFRLGVFSRRSFSHFSFGSPSRTRTCDILVNSQALYRLSYRRIFSAGILRCFRTTLKSQLEGTTCKISFFILHIYYNIFFWKNQLRFFIWNKATWKFQVSVKMFPQKLLKSPLMLVSYSQWFPILVRVSEAPCITSIVFVEFPYPLFNLHIYYNIFFLKNQERFFISVRIFSSFWKISFLTFYKYYNIFFMKNQKSFFSLPNRNLGLEATYFYGSFSNSGDKNKTAFSI